MRRVDSQIPREQSCDLCSQTIESYASVERITKESRMHPLIELNEEFRLLHLRIAEVI